MSQARESLSEYLERHEIVKYMEDAINQLLEQKDETPKMVPARFLSDYFKSAHEGTNTLFREFEYVSATTKNRKSLISCFWRCFNKLAGYGELLSGKEYHSLLCLLCYDFPLDIVQRTAHIVLMEDALDCLMSFIDFVYAFQIQFYYEEYLTLCKEVYEHLINGSSIVVPTSDTWQQKKRNFSQGNTEGVQSQAFYEAIEKLKVKLPKSAPSPDSQHVHSELSKSSKTTYFGLLMALSRNEDINSEIGVLPNRGNVHHSDDS
ncbi:centriolar satellite-associated tubulin polyglutamylase complex regulator 1-like [Styela clava]